MDSNSKFPLSASLSPLPPLLPIRAPLTLHDYSDFDSYSYFEGEGSSPSPSEEDEGSPPPPTLRVMPVAHLSTLRSVAPYNMYFNRDKTEIDGATHTINSFTPLVRQKVVSGGAVATKTTLSQTCYANTKKQQGTWKRSKGKNRGGGVCEN
ncbi:hypothetical protein RIF29_30405 [Crotalaria pallida]|uniref:Uncharacterized protein n=1 Tax=Crotalaria pallida TaxID=3830 RepID=A0AAN9EG60_CROPI